MQQSRLEEVKSLIEENKSDQSDSKYVRLPAETPDIDSVSTSRVST